MKVKVKFRDTEFGLFEPSFTVNGKDGQSYRGVYLDFMANGIPWSQLVLEEGIRGWEYGVTLDKSPVYVSANAKVYWIIESMLDSKCQGREEIEIEYEGERLAWDMFLPAIGEDDSDERHRARTTQFASCELCDVPVLLDEREVKRVDIRYSTHGTDCVVYEVENDA